MLNRQTFCDLVNQTSHDLKRRIIDSLLPTPEVGDKVTLVRCYESDLGNLPAGKTGTVTEVFFKEVASFGEDSTKVCIQISIRMDDYFDWMEDQTIVLYDTMEVEGYLDSGCDSGGSIKDFATGPVLEFHRLFEYQ